MTRGHMACLRDEKCLNDEVINIYMGLLLDWDREGRQAELPVGPRCHFFNSFFANKLYKDAGAYSYDAVERWTLPRSLQQQNQQSSCSLDVDRVIVPIHESNHWTCALIDLSAHEIVSYDSMGGHKPEDMILRALQAYIRDEYKAKRGVAVDKKWRIRCPRDAPQQQNGYDCGVFVLVSAEHLARGAPLTFSQQQMPCYRRKIAADIMNGKIL